MENPFEARGRAVPPRSERSRGEEGDLDLEMLAKLPGELRRLANDFESAIGPTIAMDRKGKDATWVDAANALYAAGKFALPRIMAGVNTLDEYFKNKGK